MAFKGFFNSIKNEVQNEIGRQIDKKLNKRGGSGDGEDVQKVIQDKFIFHNLLLVYFICIDDITYFIHLIYVHI